MTSRLRLAAVLALFCGSAAPALADEGMWLINRPPSAYLKDTYGFETTPEWLEHLQKSAVRFSTGGSGSIVSADGLVMTNHHVGSDMIAKLSTPESDLLNTGFLARTRDAELKCPDLELNVLWSIEDVTDTVNAAIKPEMSTAEQAAARRAVMADIEKAQADATGLKCEVVTLYQGGRYHLYRYRRYEDVRLVFAPEQSAAFFGGDTDNFEYPRYNIDVCLFRIYENGQPLKPEHHLKWSKDGSKEGDLAFVVGHPGSTQRLNTLSHLGFIRDQLLPFRLRSIWRREVQLQTFAGRSAENARVSKDDAFGVANGRKALTGQLAGLLDPELMARKAAAEKALRDAVNANPEWKAKWGDAWETLERTHKEYNTWRPRYQAVQGAAGGSELLGTAQTLVRMAEELPKPNGERLREYRASNLPSLNQALFSDAPIYTALEIDRITSGLSFLAENIGGSDPLVLKLLAGKSPAARAEELVLGTKMASVEERKRIAEGGKSAIVDSKDPMILMALLMDPEYRELRKRYEDTVEPVERECYAKIAQARFAVEGENVYPDATFTLRLAFGPIKGYEQNGEHVPAYTNFRGKFDRYEQRKGQEGFELPQRWLDKKSALNPDTPYNFVLTADIIGGNSGSPVVNRAGEVIGLIFDGNIQSLSWSHAFDDKVGRAVAVDSRGIIESMKYVYEATDLVNEMTRP